jgi:type I restriction enzyme S subunit
MGKRVNSEAAGIAGEGEPLPTGWCWATVGTLGGTAGFCRDGDWVESKDQDPLGDVRLVQLADVGVGVFNDRSNRRMTNRKASALGCTFLHDGDVLVSRMADPIGRACIFPKQPMQCVTVVDVAILRVDPRIVENRFAMHWFNEVTTTATVESRASGTTRKRISRSTLESLPFPVPPLAEQRRIVAKLEALLGRIRRAREALDAVPAMVERYKKSVLAELNALSYPSVALQAVVEPNGIFDGPFGSNLKTEDYTASGVRVVRLENLAWMQFDESKETFISNEKFQTLTRHEVFEGDVLVGSFIERYVRVTQVPSLAHRAIAKADCFCVRSRESQVFRPFLVYFLASESVRIELEALVHGATRPRISTKHLRDLPIPLPPLDEQRAIVARIDDAFARARSMLAAAESARAQLDTLERSLLAKAFRGELVEQDPADEPASVMLDRVRAERAKADAPAKKPRKPRGESAPSTPTEEPARVAPPPTAAHRPKPVPDSLAAARAGRAATATHAVQSAYAKPSHRKR